jgi:hypothetical protein
MPTTPKIIPISDLRQNASNVVRVQYESKLCASIFFSTVTSLAFLLVALPVYAKTYTYTEIIPPGWTEAKAYGINDNGSVVGFASSGKSFIYNGGIYTEIMPPGWTTVYALSINNNETVVGWDSGDVPARSFIYSGGTYTEVIPPGWRSAWASYGQGVNQSGLVVGHGYTGTTYKGFIYSGGTYTEIIPPGWSWAVVTGVNDDGNVVGWGLNATVTKTFLYGNGIYTEIIPPGWTEAKAYGINASGTVVGFASSGKSFIYDGGIYAEIMPPGWQKAEAFAINDSGTVVGKGSTGNLSKGFAYKDGVYTEIIPPGWVSAEAHCVNKSGAIAGFGTDRSGVGKGFIATPIPEPLVNQSGGGGGSGCFIATAAYGSYLHPFVSTLKSFRDRFLMPHLLGRSFVAWYYRMSPPIADTIGTSTIMKSAVQVVLLPAVGFSCLSLSFGLIPAILVCFSSVGMLCTGIGRLRFRHNRSRHGRQGRWKPKVT